MKYISSALVALSFIFFARGAWAKSNIEMPLKWEPTTELTALQEAGLGAFKGTVRIETFKDARTSTPKNKVGENVEKGETKEVFTTTEVTDFVTTNMKLILAKSGLEVVEKGGDYVLNGDILEYFVREENTYKGNLAIRMNLTKGNKTVWKGSLIGTNTRFGRSFKEDNYMETLSDLVIDLTAKFVQNSEVRAVFGAKEIVTAPAASDNKNPNNVPLAWKATSDLKALVNTNLGGIQGKVQIEKFKDNRTVEPKNKVGENIENKKGKEITILTDSDVSEFVTTNVRELFKKAGMDVVEKGGDYVLNGEIVDYFVSEKNTYKGNLSVRLTLSKGGKVVWRGGTVGTNTRFGRSANVNNYLETLSDTIVDFTVKLAENNEFRSQLK